MSECKCTCKPETSQNVLWRSFEHRLHELVHEYGGMGLKPALMFCGGIDTLAYIGSGCTTEAMAYKHMIEAVMEGIKRFHEKDEEDEE